MVGAPGDAARAINRLVVTLTLQAMGSRDLARMDEYLAPGFVLRGAPLLRQPGEPNQWTSLRERAEDFSARGVDWTVQTLGVEEFGTEVFLAVTALSVARRTGSGWASLGGLVFEVEAGAITALHSFTEVDEARALAAALAVSRRTAA